MRVIVLLLAVLAISYAFHGATMGSRSMRLYRGFLLHAAASPEDDAGRKVYELAGRGDTTKLAEILVDAKGNKNILNWKAKERYGRTPLVIASYYGKLDTVKLLLSTKGVDPNKGTDFGATALHFAAHRGHIDVVNLLLANRVKVNVEATGGKWTGATALDVCEGMGMQGKPEIIAAIKKKGGKPGKGKK